VLTSTTRWSDTGADSEISTQPSERERASAGTYCREVMSTYERRFRAANAPLSSQRDWQT
jgi:hypothetical protein